MPQMRLATAGAFGIAPPVPRARRAGPSPSATATPPPAYRQDSLGPRFGTLREPALPVLVDKEKGQAGSFVYPVDDFLRHRSAGRRGTEADRLPGRRSQATTAHPTTPPKKIAPRANLGPLRAY
jgi:hypothetical protein